MKAIAILALTMPFGTQPQRAANEAWKTMEVLGLVLLVGPSETQIGFTGLTMTMPVKAAGGEGTAVVRQGFSRDISVTLKEADAAQIAALFDLPPKIKIEGRIGTVELKVVGDKFDLKATGFRIRGDIVLRVEAVGNLKDRTVKAKVYAFGGLLEYEGRLPGE